MGTPYSRRPGWVAATRSFLRSIRHRPDDDLPRYGEVAGVYGGIACGTGAIPLGKRRPSDELPPLTTGEAAATAG